MEKGERTESTLKIKNVIADIYYLFAVKLKRLYRLGYKNHLIKMEMQIGADSYMDEEVYVQHPENVRIGDKVHINARVAFYANYGKITISDSVTISPDCKLIASGYDLRGFEHGERKHFKDKEIYIGQHVWLCSGVIVLPGVKILGKHVVVAAGAVVNKDIVENNVVAAGVPAEIVKRLES